MASRPIVLRFESRNGQFRLNVSPEEQFPSLQQKVRFSLLNIALAGRVVKLGRWVADFH